MEITVNGQKRSVAPGTTVERLLAELGLAGQPAAVEVNKSLVPKRRHAEQPLSPGDQIEVVTLVGGG
ncbi:MAG TPA: sulfur carrier protein ThiS [Phycisphaerales bacterium]|nr:sulfur carrier protein ThiS [Phycisphaerales bacterium]